MGQKEMWPGEMPLSWKIRSGRSLTSREEHRAPVGLQDSATEAGVTSWDQSSTTQGHPLLIAQRQNSQWEMESRWKSLQGTFVPQPFCCPFICGTCVLPWGQISLLLSRNTCRHCAQSCSFSLASPEGNTSISLELVQMYAGLCGCRWESFAAGIWDCFHSCDSSCACLLSAGSSSVRVIHCVIKY